MLSRLDEFVMHLTSSVARQHAFFDKFVVKFLDFNSVSLLPLMAVLIYLWFRQNKDLRSQRAVVEAVIGMFISVVVSRLVQNLLPLRERPLHSGDPTFVIPLGTNTDALEHWSSFPSDHAAVVFALSTAVFRVSRPLGTLCYFWGIVVTCLPRIYAGYHYASDVLSGGMLGVVVVLGLRFVLPIGAAALANRQAVRHPALFNAALFILMFEFATLFEDVRAAFRALAHTY